MIVAAPRMSYDQQFGDVSYASFRDHYKQRRQVVYVGANDGMLHAFNGGICSTNPDSFNLLASKTVRTFSTACRASDNRPLGGELWAYAPFNLLPHLKWLSAPNYSHVAYVDGDIKQYDVKIFANDVDHPEGWGTIIVASMRLVGGNYNWDHDKNTQTPNRELS